MKVVRTLALVAFLAFVTVKCSAQGDICFQLVPKDFGVWAFQKHNEVCKLVFEQVRDGKLAGYNAKNAKESQKETFAKFSARQITVFIQTDMDDPTIGKDSTYFAEKTENYYLFKTSGDYVFMKPDKNNNNLLKFKKSELLALLNDGQKEFFNAYTSGFTLCIDSIPAISKRIFNKYLSKLFNYSKLPETKLFLTDSMNKLLTPEEKLVLSQDQLMVFLSKDPNDPTVGIDTAISVDYNVNDTSKEQTIIFMIGVENFKISVHAISCGLERRLMGVTPINVPFGFLQFTENMPPFTAGEMNTLKVVMHVKMTDDLGNNRDNEDVYNDYFGADEW